MSIGNSWIQIRKHQISETEKYSKLYSLVPSIGSFFTPLPFVKAFQKQNSIYHLDEREFVPISFNDVRRLLNTAQIMAIAKTIRLITFDGDVTLYESSLD